MPRSPFSLKSAHLLDVVESAPAPRARLHPDARRPHRASPRLRRAHPLRRHRSRPWCRRTHDDRRCRPRRPTTTPSTPVIVTAKTTRTTSSVASSFSSVTTSTARPVASTSNASAMSGELSGTLEPGFESVDVPLRGPGNWTLSASASTDQSLNCGADTSPVADSSGRGLRSELPTGDRFYLGGTSLTWQLTPDHLRRVVAPLQGSALAIYFVLLPYVVVTKWHRTQRQDDGTLVRVLLVALALFWLGLPLPGRARRLAPSSRRPAPAPAGVRGSPAASWRCLSFFIPSSAGAATTVTASPRTRPSRAPRAIVATTRPTPPQRGSRPRGRRAWACMPLALMAKRRSDLIRQHQFSDADYDVDESIRTATRPQPDAAATSCAR